MIYIHNAVLLPSSKKGQVYAICCNIGTRWFVVSEVIKKERHTENSCVGLKDTQQQQINKSNQIEKLNHRTQNLGDGFG